MDEHYELLADQLRALICELFGTSGIERVILAPGILNTLHLLFAGARKRIALTDLEYYNPAHFPGHDVRVFRCDHIEEDLSGFLPDVAIVSVVSFQGIRVPVEETLSQLRPKVPLLIVDYTHAGAIGFPMMRGFDADIVCGSLAKWVTPPPIGPQLAFSWCRTSDSFTMARTILAPFYLAVQQCRPFSRAARWVNPQDVKEVVRWSNATRIDRARLLLQHQANLDLAAFLRLRFKVRDHCGAIVRVSDSTAVGDPLLSELEEAGIVWGPSDGTKRILCRAELVSLKDTI